MELNWMIKLELQYNYYKWKKCYNWMLEIIEMIDMIQFNYTNAGNNRNDVKYNGYYISKAY